MYWPITIDSEIESATKQHFLSVQVYTIYKEDDHVDNTIHEAIHVHVHVVYMPTVCYMYM